MATDNLHGAQGIDELCGRIGSGWACEGSETSTGFFMELIKTNSTSSIDLTTPSISSSIQCPSFLLSEEHKWNFRTRSVVYALGLAYCFLGLAVITGIYMKALDRIVKHTRRVIRRDSVTGIRTFREERIWNPTIADVALLALGTCAPQVSLAVIDAFEHLGDHSGNDLGAGTLLGSTAFNLFAILAVCVLAPKRFATKAIRNIGVYVVEVAWSFWAYVWLFLILQVWTPNEITLWEAITTVVQFPLLVFHAFIQDRNWKYLSLPLKSHEAAVITNFEELSIVSQNSKSATRYSTESSNAQKFQFNDDNSEVSEDVDARSRENSAFSLEPEAPPSLTWKDLSLLWRNQFYEAMSVNGNGDERKRTPSAADLIFHQLVSYWKISFAFIPPTQLLQGWLTFLGSIFFITWISFIVVELSNCFDCVTGLSSYILALTVLATGTSFPNLIASKIAAEEYETADSAIANINASNSINVFVGFGIPWCISAIYSTASHQRLLVPAHGLGFLLSVYFATAITCIVVLTTRRRFLGGELGGPRRWAWASSIFFLILWAIFLTFACLVDKFT